MTIFTKLKQENIAGLDILYIHVLSDPKSIDDHGLVPFDHNLQFAGVTMFGQSLCFPNSKGPACADGIKIVTQIPEDYVAVPAESVVFLQNANPELLLLARTIPGRPFRLLIKKSNIHSRFHLFEDNATINCSFHTAVTPGLISEFLKEEIIQAGFDPRGFLIIVPIGYELDRESWLNLGLYPWITLPKLPPMFVAAVDAYVVDGLFFLPCSSLEEMQEKGIMGYPITYNTKGTKGLGLVSIEFAKAEDIKPYYPEFAAFCKKPIRIENKRERMVLLSDFMQISGAERHFKKEVRVAKAHDNSHDWYVKVPESFDLDKATVPLTSMTPDFDRYQNILICPEHLVKTQLVTLSKAKKRYILKDNEPGHKVCISLDLKWEKMLPGYWMRLSDLKKCKRRDSKADQQDKMGRKQRLMTLYGETPASWYKFSEAEIASHFDIESRVNKEELIYWDHHPILMYLPNSHSFLCWLRSNNLGINDPITHAWFLKTDLKIESLVALPGFVEQVKLQFGEFSMALAGSIKANEVMSQK